MRKTALNFLKAAVSAVIIFILCTTCVLAVSDASTGAAVGISATGAVLIDLDTDTILYKNNMNQQCRPASLTKMMTLLVAYEKYKDKLNETVTLTSEMISVPSGSSTANLMAGDRITVYDLLYAMMLPSGNDAAKALAFLFGSTEEEFVGLMNDEAQKLGMNNTRFANTHGFDDDNHYTTTYDLALLSCALCRNQELVKIFSSYVHRAEVYREQANLTDNDDKTTGKATVTFYNTNTMLNPRGAGYFEGLKGIKTGYTSKAGNCLASYYEKNDRRLVCVVTNDNQGERDNDTRKLINYGLTAFDTFDLSLVMGKRSYIVDVNGSDEKDESNGQLELYLQKTDSKYITVSKADGEKIRNLQNSVTVRKPVVNAPVRIGDNVGDIEFIFNGQSLYSAPALAARNVDAQISSPADLVPLGIKGKIRVSFKFLTNKYFLIPFITLLVLGLGGFAAVKLKKRRIARVRARQRTLGGRRTSVRNGSSRPGSRNQF